MKLEVHVNPSKATESEFAEVTIHCNTLSIVSVIDLEFNTLFDRCKIPRTVVLDFLFLAAVVYGIDKLIPRKQSNDQWTRTLEVSVPVCDPDIWFHVKGDLETCLSFLTGDVWRLYFTTRQYQLHRPRPRKRRRRNVPLTAQADAVCLFSGGLDSLIGGIDYLEDETSHTLFFVGHHDYSGGPMSDQKRLYCILKEAYQSRIDLLQVRIGPKPAGREKTFRSRSFLFIALGLYSACAIGERTPLLMPENGAIALNVPLTPSRRGSCSTRTAHPFFLETLRKIMVKLELENPITNPLEFKTKGECLQQCLNRDLLKAATKESVSCAKRWRKQTWTDKSARHCGRCVPCIYRRASLHRLDWALENYGSDICIGDVNLQFDKELANDFRAMVSFLSRNDSNQEIASLLLANGKLEIAQLPKYADVVGRSMDEIRALLRDKGTDEIKRRAGLIS